MEESSTIIKRRKLKQLTSEDVGNFGKYQNIVSRPRYSSMVERPLMVHWVVGLIPHGGPIELFLALASAPRLV